MARVALGMLPVHAIITVLPVALERWCMTFVAFQPWNLRPHHSHFQAWDVGSPRVPSFCTQSNSHAFFTSLVELAFWLEEDDREENPGEITSQLSVDLELEGVPAVARTPLRDTLIFLKANPGQYKISRTGNVDMNKKKKITTKKNKKSKEQIKFNGCQLLCHGLRSPVKGRGRYSTKSDDSNYHEGIARIREGDIPFMEGDKKDLVGLLLVRVWLLGCQSSVF
jgi:hypothetical protein